MFILKRKFCMKQYFILIKFLQLFLLVIFMKEFKIGVFGNHFVGKTTFILNFITKKNRENRIEDPNDNSSFGKFLEIKSETIFIRIFENPPKKNEMNGLIYLFSLSDKQSFNDLIINYDSKFPCNIFVGNEFEKDKKEFENEIIKFTKEIGSKFMICNALKGDNVENIFIEIIEIIKDFKNKYKKDESNCLIN